VAFPFWRIADSNVERQSGSKLRTAKLYGGIRVTDRENGSRSKELAMTNSTSNIQQNSGPVNTKQQSKAQRSEVLNRITLASMLVFAGLVLITETLGLLPQIEEASAWDWIFLGVGGLLLLESLIRILMIDHAEPGLWRWIIGIVLLGIGIGPIFNAHLTENWWPIILIILGLSALARGIRRR
jgi:hypothetical protein